MKKTKIETWLTSSIKEIKATGITCDIHINEFISQKMDSPIDLFYNSLIVFNEFCQRIN